MQGSHGLQNHPNFHGRNQNEIVQFGGSNNRQAQSLIVEIYTSQGMQYIWRDTLQTLGTYCIIIQKQGNRTKSKIEGRSIAVYRGEHTYFIDVGPEISNRLIASFLSLDQLASLIILPERPYPDQVRSPIASIQTKKGTVYITSEKYMDVIKRARFIAKQGEPNIFEPQADITVVQAQNSTIFVSNKDYDSLIVESAVKIENLVSMINQNFCKVIQEVIPFHNKQSTLYLASEQFVGHWKINPKTSVSTKIEELIKSSKRNTSQNPSRRQISLYKK